MSTLITLLLLVTVAYALTRYARHDGLSVPRPRTDARDELDRIRPTHVLG